eukprot:TRINITY_DN47799_c0_g1_i1.p1 TRINITY_DN47799_c0_g1~~TRINITY_DN47799_c0_g1_i1.p1  ORF type:complete len:744 (+),score=195.53 TRINITY_DN47799_c0_g1_i1:109-2232(+)
MGEQRRGVKLEEFMANSPAVLCAAFSPGEPRWLATGGSDNRVRVTQVRDGGMGGFVLVGHQAAVTSVVFSHNSSDQLVGGSDSGQLRVWDVSRSQEKKAYTQGTHRGEITALDYHPFGDFFVSSSDDSNIKVWDLRKKTCLQTYKHQEGKAAGCPRVETVRFSPDGRLVASGNADGSINIWDLTAGKRKQRIQHHRSSVVAIDFHPQEFIVTAGCSGGLVSFWDMDNWAMLAQTQQLTQAVRRVCFSPCGAALLSATDFGMHVWDWPNNTPATAVPVAGTSNMRDSVPLSCAGVGALAAYSGQQGAAGELYAASFAKSFVTVHLVRLGMLAPWASPGSGDGARLAVAGPCGSPAVPAPRAQGSSGAARVPSRSAEQWPPREVLDAAAGPLRRAGAAVGAAAHPHAAAPDPAQQGRRGPATPPSGPRPRYHHEPPTQPQPSPQLPSGSATPPTAAHISGSAGLPAERTPPNPAPPPQILGQAAPAAPVRPSALFPPGAAGVVSPGPPPRPHELAELCAVTPPRAMPEVGAAGLTRKTLDDGPPLQLVLQARHTHLSTVRSLWPADSALAAEHMISACSDPSLWADVLSKVGHQQVKRTLTAPVCAALLEAASALLNDRYHYHVAVAVKAIRVMFSVLQGPLTRALQGRVDEQHRAERQRAEKHRQCAQTFSTCRERLRQLCDAPGVSEELRQECRTLGRDLSALPPSS